MEGNLAIPAYSNTWNIGLGNQGPRTKDQKPRTRDPRARSPGTGNQ